MQHSGESVLRGTMPKLRDATAQGNKAAALGQTVLRPPAESRPAAACPGS